LVKRRLWKLTLGLLLAMLPAQAGPIDPESLPAEQRENYDAFRVRCSKCHTLDKPFNVHLSTEGWKRYVGKMQRRPGSGINDENGARIVEFLLYKEARELAPAPAAPAPAAPPAAPADAGAGAGAPGSR
jgi:hypothetical protein